MSIHKRPTVRQIQPIGFLGRLEAVRAPTMGKARKVMKISASPAVLHAPAPSRAGRGRTDSTMIATAMARQSPASDQASQEAVRVLLAPPLRSCSPAPLFTTPLYSTTVSKALREPLEGSPLWVNFAPA